MPEAHRDTTAVLGGAYPYLAGPPSASGIYIGHDAITGAPFCYDPWQLYQDQVISNPNMLIVGNIGWGKTNTAMSIALRNIAHGRRVIVPGDPKDDWIRLADALCGHVIRLGPGSPQRLNPLDLGPPPPGVDATLWRQQSAPRTAQLLAAIVETIAPGLAPLHPESHRALKRALDAAIVDRAMPIIPDVIRHLESQSGTERFSRPAAAALSHLCTGSLAGMLDGPTTARPRPDAPITVIATGALGDDDVAHNIVMLAASAATRTHQPGRQTLLIYDEAWRILTNPAQLARINAELRLSRARGTATILITHALSDTDPSGRANAERAAGGLAGLCDTRVLFRQAPGETGRTAAELNLTRPQRGVLTTLRKGQALWTIADRAHIVTTLLTPAEAALFSTDRPT